MGTRGLVIVRFRGRYYLRWNQYDSYYQGLGAQLVASIPADPEEYSKWLESMRAYYAAKESALEDLVYEIRDGEEPDLSQFGNFAALPSEIPRLGGAMSLFAEYIYIINLDAEVLTMDYGIHWNMKNIPRENRLWLRAIKNSIYLYKPTISLELCSEEHMGSPALELPQPNPKIEYNFRYIVPRTSIKEPRKAFLTRLLAGTLLEYKDEIINFGREWAPDSFPFRELVFALVSIASGQAKFHSFPAQRCSPRSCVPLACKEKHLPKAHGWSHGWLGEEWAGDSAPLLEFGSPSHRPGETPGASPTAITNAVTWGIEQGGTINFQVVVLSLFEAAFADVSFDDGKPFVKVSENVHLSPLRASYCMSTHPRERPELKDGMQPRRPDGERIMKSKKSNCAGTMSRLRNLFPGVAALVNFFEAAQSRRVPLKSGGILPQEMYDRILDFVDYDTWKACLLVSPIFRSSCLRKYRLDNRMSIVAGPFVRLQKGHEKRLLSFNFEDMQTGKILPMIEVPPHGWDEWIEKCNWMPVVGSGHRKALMVDVSIQFEPAEDVPVEADSDDE